MSDGYDGYAPEQADDHNYDAPGYEAPEMPGMMPDMPMMGGEIGQPMDALLVPDVNYDGHEGGEDYKEDDQKNEAPGYGADYVDPKDTKVEDYNPAAH